MNRLHRRVRCGCGSVAVGAAVLAAAWGAAVQTAPQQAEQDRLRDRDLVFETPDGETVQLAGVPRGYALVIGVGEYRNLRRGAATAVREERRRGDVPRAHQP